MGVNAHAPRSGRSRIAPCTTFSPMGTSTSGVTGTDESRRDSVRVWGMRPGITVDVTAADRARLEAVMADRNSPGAKAMHVILDNYAAHKHPKVIAWARSPPLGNLPLHADQRL